VTDSATATIPANRPTGTESAVVSAACPAGKVLLGGGVNVTNGGVGKQVATIELSAPSTDGATPAATGATPTSWIGKAIVSVQGATANVVTAYVVCTG